MSNTPRRNFFKHLLGTGIGLTVVTNQEAIEVPKIDPRDKLIEELTAKAKELEDYKNLTRQRSNSFYQTSFISYCSYFRTDREM